MNIQQLGENIANKYQLLQVLQKVGEAHLVGNLALGTTVKPDIDYLIYLDKNSWHTASEQIKDAFTGLGLSLSHERNLKESGKYLITFSVAEGGYDWSIDITLSEKGGDYLSDSYKFFVDYKDNFTKDRVDVMLKLKKHFYQKGMLRNSMSYYIYRAVIDKAAKTPADVYKYLRDTGVYLGRFKIRNH